MAKNKRETILKLIALARKESNAPRPEREVAFAKADGLRKAMKVSWSQIGVDAALVERLSNEFSEPIVEQTGADTTPKPPRAAGSARGKGIGKLAERLIVEHPDWTYRRIAEEVNARIEGAHASEKSVRWYASKMRRRGIG